MGIVVISNLDKAKRAFMILSLIAVSEIALFLFYITPDPYSAIWMFFNGLPLGLIWGLVFSYLEGRRTSEVLGIGMCISFIFSSSVIKTIGKTLVNKGLNEKLMPVVVGAIFYPIICLFTFCIELIPPPNEEDIRNRTERVQMNHSDRIKFFCMFWPGIMLMICYYMLVCGYRDFRDNFMIELFEEMGEKKPEYLTYTDLIVTCVIVLIVGLMMLIKNHLIGFYIYHIVIIAGNVVNLLGTILYKKAKINGIVFQVIVGVAIYIAYVPYSSILFDRMIASFKVKANSGFLIYIADSCGYVTAIVFMFVKEMGSHKKWLPFFIQASFVMSVAGITLQSLSLVYYFLRAKTFPGIKEGVPDKVESIFTDGDLAQPEL